MRDFAIILSSMTDKSQILAILSSTCAIKGYSTQSMDVFVLLCSVECPLDFYGRVHDRCKFGANYQIM